MAQMSCFNSFVGIVTGNPGVFQGYLDSYPPEPGPVARVGVLTGLGRSFSGFHRLKNPHGSSIGNGHNITNMYYTIT